MGIYQFEQFERSIGKENGKMHYLFERSNVFDECELDRESNVQNLHIANSDKPVTFYNLDGIISVEDRKGTCRI